MAINIDDEGKLLFTTGDSGILKVWDINSYELLLSKKVADGQISAMCYLKSVEKKITEGEIKVKKLTN